MGILSSQSKRIQVSSQPVSARCRCSNGKPSEYGFLPLTFLPVGKTCLVAVRESGHVQEWNGNLKKQVRELVKSTEGQGGEVRKILTHVGSGWDFDWVEEVAEVAKESMLSVVIESVDRLVRSTAYHSDDYPNVQASPGVLKMVREVLGGVQVYTVVSPDATPGEVRAYQTWRGMQKHAGGRPKGSSQVDDVAEFIKRLLQDGPMEVVRLEQLVVQVCQVSHNTFKRARKQAGVKSRKTAFEGAWEVYLVD